MPGSMLSWRPSSVMLQDQMKALGGDELAIAKFHGLRAAGFDYRPAEDRGWASMAHTSPQRLSTPEKRTRNVLLKDDRSPKTSEGRHFTLEWSKNDLGAHQISFEDHHGAREITLIAKRGAEEGRDGQSSPPCRDSPVIPHIRREINVMGIARKVQVRLANELQEAQTLLALERQRTSEMKKQIELDRQSSLDRHPFLGRHLCTTQTTPDKQLNRAQNKHFSLTPTTAPLSRLSRSSMSRGNTRGSVLSIGRSLDPTTGVTRSATWRLQNQWGGGLNWREFPSDGDLLLSLLALLVPQYNY